MFNTLDSICTVPKKGLKASFGEVLRRPGISLWALTRFVKPKKYEQTLRDSYMPKTVTIKLVIFG